jgi:hypothetical protein
MSVLNHGRMHGHKINELTRNQEVENKDLQMVSGEDSQPSLLFYLSNRDLHMLRPCLVPLVTRLNFSD